MVSTKIYGSATVFNIDNIKK